MKKLSTLLIAFALVAICCVFLLPTQVQAATSGTCGDNLTWTLDDDGTLTISGTGPMYDYCSVGVMYDVPMSLSYSEPFIPWDRHKVTKIIIEEGVTSIGDGAFHWHSIKDIKIANSVTVIGDAAFESAYIKSITLPENLTYIGYWAFLDCDGFTNITIPKGVTHLKSSAFSRASDLEKVIFEGEAPTFGSNIFSDLTLTAYYPVNYPNWIEKAGKDYGGNVTWIAYCDHKWLNATCTAPKMCSICNLTDGNKLGHHYIDGYCIRCKIPVGYTGIYTKEDLLKIQDESSGKYILMNDIIFQAQDFASTGAYYNNGEGWIPKKFYGTLDGNGFSIVNLSVNSNGLTTYGNKNIGLVSVNSGTIQNLTMLNADVYVEDDTSMNVGIICGTNEGIIENCHTSGKIYIKFASNSCGDSYIGGVAGFSDGGIIRRCSNSADIGGHNDFVFPYMVCGGILGGVRFSEKTNIIEQCYNTGDFNPYTVSNSYFGGIAGRVSTGGLNNNSAFSVYIKDCYNTGTVSATGNDSYKIGGIAGEYHQYTSIINCYNIGKIKETQKEYGAITALVWSNVLEFDISTAYYLDESCAYALYNDRNDALTAVVGNKLTASQMKVEASFVGFDFDNIWIVDANADYPYPQLRNNLQSQNKPIRHNYTQAIIKEATCVEYGINKHTCIDCGFTLNVDINETDHSYDNGAETKTPTCKEAGIKTFTCTVCGDSYTEEIAKTNNHSYADGVCTVCGGEDPTYVPPTEPTEPPNEPSEPTEPTEPTDPTEPGVDVPGDPDNDKEEGGFFAAIAAFFEAIFRILFFFLYL